MGYLEEQTKNINDRYNADLERRLREIESAKQQQVSALNKKKEEESLNFHNQRVDIDTQNALDTMKNKEFMASMGSYNSGDNITANSRINSNRAKGMSGVTANENQFNRDIADRISQAGTNALNQSNDVRNTISMEQARALQVARDTAYQMEMQRQAQARAAASSSRNLEAEKNSFLSQFNGLMNEDVGEARSLLFQNKDDIMNRYGNKYYNNLMKIYTDKLARDVTKGFGNMWGGN